MHLAKGHLSSVIDEHIQDLEPHIGLSIKELCCPVGEPQVKPKIALVDSMSNAVMPPVFMLARCVSSSYERSNALFDSHVLALRIQLHRMA